MEIKLYTDGACKGNPGNGGYGCVLTTTLKNGQPYEVHHSQGYKLTTNNRMELMAVIAGLEAINGSHTIEVISDSQYVCNAFNKNWIKGWKASHWKSGTLPNLDLWERLDSLIATQESVKFTWVKGHAGHRYNELCDELAVTAAQDYANLIDDKNYSAK